MNIYTEGQDAVFLPGKIHGCENQVYIIYFNPSANDEKGCWEIEILDADRIIRLYQEAKGDAEQFFAILPDRFQGEWKYCNSGTPEFREFADKYPNADFILNEHGSQEDEMHFLVNWACKVLGKKKEDLLKSRSSFVKSSRMFSPQAYVEAVTGHTFIFKQENTVKEIRDILDRYCMDQLWDYPLNEIDHIVENNLNVVLVEVTGFDENGKWKQEFRWYEVPEDFEDEET